MTSGMVLLSVRCLAITAIDIFPEIEPVEFFVRNCDMIVFLVVCFYMVNTYEIAT